MSLQLSQLRKSLFVFFFLLTWKSEFCPSSFYGTEIFTWDLYLFFTLKVNMLAVSLFFFIISRQVKHTRVCQLGKFFCKSYWSSLKPNAMKRKFAKRIYTKYKIIPARSSFLPDVGLCTNLAHLNVIENQTSNNSKALKYTNCNPHPQLSFWPCQDTYFKNLTW